MQQPVQARKQKSMHRIKLCRKWKQSCRKILRRHVKRGDVANRRMSAEKTPNYDRCEVKDSQECTRCEDRIYMRLTAEADE
jgi:hypothetical protein